MTSSAQNSAGAGWAASIVAETHWIGPSARNAYVELLPCAHPVTTLFWDYPKTLPRLCWLVCVSARSLAFSSYLAIRLSSHLAILYYLLLRELNFHDWCLVKSHSYASVSEWVLWIALDFRNPAPSWRNFPCLHYSISTSSHPSRFQTFSSYSSSSITCTCAYFSYCGSLRKRYQIICRQHHVGWCWCLWKARINLTVRHSDHIPTMNN